MESGEKLIEKIPDVWFDWFARFIPGAAGVLIYFLLHESKIPSEIDGWTVFFFVILSYLIGHVIQPLSGIFVKGIELAVDAVFFERKREKKYTEAKRKTHFSLLGKISKAHAEANSMLSICFVIVINVYILSNTSVSLLVQLLPLYFLAATVERVFARVRKIDDLP